MTKGLLNENELAEVIGILEDSQLDDALEKLEKIVGKVVSRYVGDTLADSLHPEFGSEWREDGVIHKALQSQRQQHKEEFVRIVREHAEEMRDYMVPTLDPKFIDGYNHALSLIRRDATLMAEGLSND